MCLLNDTSDTIASPPQFLSSSPVLRIIASNITFFKLRSEVTQQRQCGRGYGYSLTLEYVLLILSASTPTPKEWEKRKLLFFNEEIEKKTEHLPKFYHLDLEVSTRRHS